MTTTPTLTPTPDELVHRSPAIGESETPCCGRSIFDLPETDRLTNFPDLVTCGRPGSDQLALGQEEPELPVRPYTQQGQPSAGYASGSQTSQAAEPARASAQGDVLSALRLTAAGGLTGTEATRTTGRPRLSVGAALSVLHQSGHVARLTEVRDGQAVYVAVEYVNGRETEERGRHGARTCHVCGAEQL